MDNRLRDAAGSVGIHAVIPEYSHSA